MQWNVKCLACGKIFPLPPESGQSVLCSACGTWLTIPPLPVRSSATGHVGSDERSSLLEAGDDSTDVPRSRTLAAAVGMSLVGLAAVASIALCVWLLERSPAPRTPPAHRVAPPATAPVDELQLRIYAMLLAQEERRLREMQTASVTRPVAASMPATQRGRATTNSQGGPHPDPLPQAGEGEDHGVVSAQPQTVALSVPASAPATQALVVVTPAPSSAPASPVTMPATPVAASQPALPSPGDPVEASTRKAAGFLLAQFDKEDLRLGKEGGPAHHAGLHALCVAALLEAGRVVKDDRLSIHSPGMKDLIDRMKRHVIGDAGQTPSVLFARAMRVLALAVHNREEDRDVLRDDVNWLVAAQGGGTADTRSATARWDNDSAQLALHALHRAAACGLDVPATTWRDAHAHWTASQLADGTWAYDASGREGSYAMTVGGIASLLAIQDHYDPDNAAKPGRDPHAPAVAKSLAWLGTDDNCLNVLWGRPASLGYSLHALARAGLAAGYTKFGSHDWYRKLSGRLVASQFPTGAWGRQPEGVDAVTDTAQIVLFLSLPRHPIMIAKLRLDEAWANRPRDLANLAAFASRELGRPLRWRIATLQSDWTDWLDAPVLYLASHQYVRLTDADVEKLRRYTEAGGLLFTHADDASDSFNRFVGDLAQRLFPLQALSDLPADHPLFSAEFRIPPRTVSLKGIHSGGRLLLAHSPADLSLAWQQRNLTARRGAFDLGVNIHAQALAQRRPGGQRAAQQ